MIQSVLLSVVLCLVQLATAQAEGLSLVSPHARLSAIRASEESFEQAATRVGAKIQLPSAMGKRNFGLFSLSAVQSAKPVGDFDVLLAPLVPIDLQSLFTELRDTAYFSWQMSGQPFNRRITFLYPDDGCFARAEKMVEILKQKNLAPKKIFAFGSLSVRTPHSPVGQVTWWYHVAPLVASNGQNYVIDPSIEPMHPLTMQEWLHRMTSDTSSLKIAVCSAGTYDPDSACQFSVEETARAQSDESNFLDLEWQRQVQLGRDPSQVLGLNPPWLTPLQ